MEQKLKNILPDFNINNFSYRDIDEIVKITKLCHKIDDLLVFIQRTEKNDDYFTIVEREMNAHEINIIFLHKDDIYYYSVTNDNNTIMSLKRKLCMETECVICMEQCVNNYCLCSKCGHQIHITCFVKCNKQVCPICKNKNFMYNK